MKLYLKDTIFKIHIWNKKSHKWKIWYEFVIPDLLLDLLYNYYKKELDGADCGDYDFQGVTLAINEQYSEGQVEAFNQYFRNKIQYEISNIIIETMDSTIHEIDHIKMTAYIDITEEELLYLKLKYPEIFEG